MKLSVLLKPFTEGREIFRGKFSKLVFTIIGMLIPTLSLAQVNLSDLSPPSNKEFRERMGVQDYDPSQTYILGQLIKADDGIYRNITAIDTPEDFTASRWEKVASLGDNFFEVNDEATLLLITDATQGDLAFQLDSNRLYRHLGTSNGDLSDWYLLLQAADQISAEISVALLNDDGSEVTADSADNSSFLTPLRGLQLLLKNLLTSAFRLSDETDNSKKMAFDLSPLSASTTRTLTVPDEDLTLVDEARIGARDYSSSRTYRLGQLISLEDGLYKNISAITTPEEFSAEKWKKVASQLWTIAEAGITGACTAGGAEDCRFTRQVSTEGSYRVKKRLAVDASACEKALASAADDTLAEFYLLTFEPC